MLIEVTAGVYWDTEEARQSEEAIAWLRENILPQMSMKSIGIGIIPEFDCNRRPIRWVIPSNNCTVEIEREYVRPNSTDWGMKNDKITVYGN